MVMDLCMLLTPEQKARSKQLFGDLQNCVRQMEEAHESAVLSSSSLESSADGTDDEHEKVLDVAAADSTTHQHHPTSSLDKLGRCQSAVAYEGHWWCAY